MLVARPRESRFTTSASQTAELDQDIVAVLTGSQSPSHTRRVISSISSKPISFKENKEISFSSLKISNLNANTKLYY